MSNNDFDTVLSSSEELEEFMGNRERRNFSTRLDLLRFYTSGFTRQPLSELYEIARYAYWLRHALLAEADFDKTFAFVDLADIMVLD